MSADSRRAALPLPPSLPSSLPPSLLAALLSPPAPPPSPAPEPPWASPSPRSSHASSARSRCASSWVRGDSGALPPSPRSLAAAAVAPYRAAADARPARSLTDASRWRWGRGGGRQGAAGSGRGGGGGLAPSRGAGGTRDTPRSPFLRACGVVGK